MTKTALPLRLAWQLVVLDDPTLTPMAKLLTFALLSYMDAKGSCFPRVELLARRMGVHRNTVKRARAELVAAGLLRVAESSGHSNTYAALLRG